MVDERRCNGEVAPELGHKAGLGNQESRHVGDGEKR